MLSALRRGSCWRADRAGRSIGSGSAANGCEVSCRGGQAPAGVGLSEDPPVRLTLLLDMAAEAFGPRVLAGARSGGITAAQLAGRSHSGAGLVRERGAEAVVYLAVNGPAFPVAL